MNTARTQRGLPAVILTTTGLVALGAFLPWLTVTTQIPPSALDQVAAIGHTDGAGLLRALGWKLPPVIVTTNGWSGEVELLGITMPTWLIPAMALFVAAHALMRLAPNTHVPRWLPVFFGFAGLLFLIITGVSALTLGNGSHAVLLPGWYLTLLAYLLMLRALIRGDAADTPPAAEMGQGASA